MILEEALETIDALGITVYYNGRPINPLKPVLKIERAMRFLDFVDGCADISVVTIGSLVAAGVDDEPVLGAVDQANLNKFEPPECPICGDAMELKEGVAGSRFWICGEYNPDATEGQRHLLPMQEGPYQRDDGKWIKPPYWQAPDLEAAIKAGDMTNSNDEE